MNYRRKNNYKPGTQDDCQTPPYAVTDELVDLYLPEVIYYDYSYCDADEELVPRYDIWECAMGDGYLYRSLVRKTLIVVGTDINSEDPDYRLDFLSQDGIDFQKLQRCYAVVTNPPYSMWSDFMERCMDLKVNYGMTSFALLMQSTALFTKTYDRLCDKYNIYPSICKLGGRVDFKMPNKGWSGKGAHFDVAWYVCHPLLEPNKIYSWHMTKTKPSEDW